jgi:hypothetical protein
MQNRVERRTHSKPVAPTASLSICVAQRVEFPADSKPYFTNSLAMSASMWRCSPRQAARSTALLLTAAYLVDCASAFLSPSIPVGQSLVCTAASAKLQIRSLARGSRAPTCSPGSLDLTASDTRKDDVPCSGAAETRRAPNLVSLAAGVVAAAALVLLPGVPSPVGSSSGVAAAAEEVAAMAQDEEHKLIGEVLRLVDDHFLDLNNKAGVRDSLDRHTYNGVAWADVRQEVDKKQLKDRKATYKEIKGVLKRLGDRFTRFVDPKQARPRPLPPARGKRAARRAEPRQVPLTRPGRVVRGPHQVRRHGRGLASRRAQRRDLHRRAAARWLDRAGSGAAERRPRPLDRRALDQGACRHVRRSCLLLRACQLSGLRALCQGLSSLWVLTAPAPLSEVPAGPEILWYVAARNKSNLLFGPRRACRHLKRSRRCRCGARRPAGQRPRTAPRRARGPTLRAQRMGL